MFHLEEKLYLYGLFLLPLLVGVYVGFVFWQRKMQRRFVSYYAFQRLMPEHSWVKQWLKVGIVLWAIGLGIVSLANPQMGTKLEKVKREGADIVFAIDVSKSMLANDVKPNRLEKAQLIVSKIVDKLKGDRVGLVPYAGQAFAQLPLTNDYGAVKMFVQHMSTNMLSSQGTAIDQAIKTAETYFDSKNRVRFIFVISDGEDHESGVEQAIEMVREKGIFVHSIGIGTPQGSTIPVWENGQKSVKKDENNQVVITRLQPQLLEQIAQKGKGKYFYGEPTEEVVRNVEKLLQNIEKNQYNEAEVSNYQSQFQWLVALAIFLLVLDSFIFEKKTKWLEKLNLFGETK